MDAKANGQGQALPLQSNNEKNATRHRRHHCLRAASGFLVLAHGAAPRLRLRTHRPLLSRGLRGAGLAVDVAAGHTTPGRRTSNER